MRRGKPLTNRQQRLLDELPNAGSRAVVRKDGVSMRDLAALTAKTGVEFALFTCGPKRLVVRGDARGVYLEETEVERLIAQGYKWSGHTHPGDSLIQSEGDEEVLRMFPQCASVIYNMKGEFNRFPKN